MENITLYPCRKCGEETATLLVKLIRSPFTEAQLDNKRYPRYVPMLQAYCNRCGNWITNVKQTEETKLQTWFDQYSMFEKLRKQKE